MKKYFVNIILFGALILVSNSFAQQGGRGMGFFDIKVLEERIALADTQKVEIENILKVAQEKIQELRNDETLERADRMLKFREIQEKVDEDILIKLNDEQKKEYQKMIEERKEKMKQRLQNSVK